MIVNIDNKIGQTMICSKFFQEFDMFPAPATLRIGGEPDKKSTAIGALSFMVSLFFFYLFISLAIDLFEYKNISFVETYTVILALCRTLIRRKPKPISICLQSLLILLFIARSMICLSSVFL